MSTWQQQQQVSVCRQSTLNSQPVAVHSSSSPHFPFHSPHTSASHD